MKHGKKMLAVLTALSMLAGATSSRSMTADAMYSCTVNVIMGTTETAIYGVPNAFHDRFERISARVYGFYRGAFNAQVTLALASPAPIIRTAADECTMNSGNYNWFCQCTSMVNCSNEGPYHHTNAENILFTLYPRPRPAVDPWEMYITASPLCHVTTSHNMVAGIAYGGKFIVRDTDYIEEEDVGLGNYTNVAWVSGTAIHELGHAFGAVDHYHTYYGDDRDDCIWGYNHTEEDIVNSITVCANCRTTLINYFNQFN